MNNPVISIIVPVYNVEEFLSQCIHSILKQKFNLWELLLIDDGSTDNSGYICDSFANKDSRIKVIRKENGGVSSARNCGLNIAHGEWVTFIDADDYIEGDYLGVVRKCEYDLIVLNSRHYNKSNITKYTEPKIPNMRINHAVAFRRFLSYYFNAQKIRTPWAKFFKKELINDLRFDETMRIGEDTDFVFKYFFRCSSVCTRNTGIYNYFENNTPDTIRYKISEEKALYTLEHIFSSYYLIGANCKQLEESLLCYFSSICDLPNGKHSSLWNNNEFVKKLQLTSSKKLTFSDRVKSYIYNHSLTAYLDPVLFVDNVYNFFVRR